MEMAMKEALLMFWVVTLVALTILVHHFLGCAMYLLENAVASGLGFMPILARVAFGAFGAWIVH
jgi:hypothetical protein